MYIHTNKKKTMGLNGHHNKLDLGVLQLENSEKGMS